MPEEKKSKDELVEKDFGVQLLCEEKKRSITLGTATVYDIQLKNLGKKEEEVHLKIDLIYSTSQEDEGPEWNIELKEKEGGVWEISRTKIMERDVEMKGHESRELFLGVTPPRGARYGDRLSVVVTATSTRDPALSDSITTSTIARQTILAVKTAIGHEKSVADSIASRARDKETGIFSILAPTSLRGYLLVEAMSAERLGEIVKGMRRARRVVEGETSFEEIDHFLTPKPLVAGINEGDVVELIAGPFKGEKARVQHIDESKEEITVELFEAMVPIPVTVRGDSVRVLEKEK